MTCRHAPGDPNCGSYEATLSHYRSIVQQADRSLTPDSKNYTIDKAERVGSHLVLQVKYPNCAKCAYEGNKVMVFLNVSEIDALRWREIDPHFRDTKKHVVHVTSAPSPAARFPASADGWSDAVEFAKRKSVGRDGVR